MSSHSLSTASTFPRAGFLLPHSKSEFCPELKQFVEMAGHYDFLPVYTSTRLEALDAARLFEQLDAPAPAALLESLNGRDNGRYSIIATRSLMEISSYFNEAPGIDRLGSYIEGLRVPALDFPFFSGGLLGYFSYESSLEFVDLPRPASDSRECFFFLPSEVLVYDRHDQVLTIIVWAANDQNPVFTYTRLWERLDQLLTLARQSACGLALEGSREVPGEGGARVPESGQPVEPEGLEEGFKANRSQKEFEEMVIRAKEHIRRGDIFQAVLSRRWSRTSGAPPWKVYQGLRRVNPSPYMFYLKLPDAVLMGASPEMMVKVSQGTVKTRPIAGTRKITGRPREDEAALAELAADEKENAEHLMLVDLGRNDIGKVAAAGSVCLSEFKSLERYSHVVHIVSTVEGRLKPSAASLDAFKACFPAGTLSGAPKRRAMQIIQELEGELRGPYGGAIAHIGFDGSFDSCITIRSILVREGKYYLQSGAGIVADSIPEMEHEETLHKARVLMLTIKEAEEQ